MNIQKLSLGCDPELFFSKDGKVIGSERIIPMEGVSLPSGGRIIRDGIQAELNPTPKTRIDELAVEIGLCFAGIEELLLNHKDINIDFSRSIDVEQKEFDSVSDSSKQFGCSPTNNVYNINDTVIDVDPMKYKGRSAGGHIHIGCDDDDQDTRNVLSDYERIIPLLDVLVGNTCVLLDQDRGNSIRRSIYGKAGEYRTPVYGIEYRTLSNFWLQSSALFDFVMKMVKLTVSIAVADKDKKIMGLSNIETVRKAINENNVSLAKENFNLIKGEIIEIIDTVDTIHNMPLSRKDMGTFEKIITENIDLSRKTDIFNHWKDIAKGNMYRWSDITRKINK